MNQYIGEKPQSFHKILSRDIYAKWEDPYQNTDIPVICFMKKEDVIKYQMTRYHYKSDEEAFKDFLVNNYATEIIIHE